MSGGGLRAFATSETFYKSSILGFIVVFAACLPDCSLGKQRVLKLKLCGRLTLNDLMGEELSGKNRENKLDSGRAGAQ